MNPVYAAAVEMLKFVRARKWRFSIIGGLAVVRCGEVRATDDVDISLLVELGDERPYIDKLLKKFKSRFPDAAEFALQNRVLLLTASNGVSMDVGLASFSYDIEVVERASSYRFHKGVNLVTASAEDLVILKLLAERPIDLFDIRGILVRQQHLDWNYLTSRLHGFSELKPETDMLALLESLRPSS